MALLVIRGMRREKVLRRREEMVQDREDEVGLREIQVQLREEQVKRREERVDGGRGQYSREERVWVTNLNQLQ